MVKNNFKGQGSSTNESEVESKIVTVGSNKGHALLIIAVIAMMVGVLYYFYLGNTRTEKNIDQQEEKRARNVKELQDMLEPIPDSIPIHERRVVLPPLPPIIEPQNVPEIKPEVKQEVKLEVEQEEKQKSEKEERKKPIIGPIPVLSKKEVIRDFPVKFSAAQTSGGKERRQDTMTAFSNTGGSGSSSSVVSGIGTPRTSASHSKVTFAGGPGCMIAQGKIIDAVLETAITYDISSDAPRTIRAVVSRDVYAEAGSRVLVPRGSRLIGQYTFDPEFKNNIARARVNMYWNRIILPNGRDIVIPSAPSIDNIGRAGIRGTVDNKIATALLSSISTAGIAIGSAVIAQKASNLVGGLSLMEIVRSLPDDDLDISYLHDTKILGDITVSKLPAPAVKRLKKVTRDADLLNKFREEVKKLLKDKETEAAERVGNINLDHIRIVLKGQSSKTVYENIAQRAIENFTNDMRSIVTRYTNKGPTIYIDQGRDLKIFVIEDILISSF